MMHLEKTHYGIVASVFDGAQWHRESFPDTDQLYIWAHKHGITLDDCDIMGKSEEKAA
mgnify:CR=1 FL=1